MLHVTKGRFTQEPVERRTGKEYLRQSRTGAGKDDCVMCFPRTKSAMVSATLFLSRRITRLRGFRANRQVRFNTLDFVARHLRSTCKTYNPHPIAAHARARAISTARGASRSHANGNPFAHAPVLVNVLRVHIGLEAAIHLLGHLPQGQFAQAIRLPGEKIFQRAFTFSPVNISRSCGSGALRE